MSNQSQNQIQLQKEIKFIQNEICSCENELKNKLSERSQFRKVENYVPSNYDVDIVGLKIKLESLSKLETKIKRIVENSSKGSLKNPNKIEEGDRVKVKIHYSPGEDDEFQVVLSDKKYSDKTCASLNSPLAKAIIGRKRGDFCTFYSGKNKISAQILDFHKGGI